MRSPADPAVLSVTPYSHPKLLDERASQIVAGNVTVSDPGPSRRRTSRGTAARASAANTFDFAIDFTDEGLDNGSSPARITPTSTRTVWRRDRPSSTRAITRPTAPAEDCGGHGTNVASIAAGYNAQGATAYNDSGQLPLRHRRGPAGADRCLEGLRLQRDVASSSGERWSGGRLREQRQDLQQLLGQRGLGCLHGRLPGPTTSSSATRGRGRRHQPMVEVFAAGNDRRPGHRCRQRGLRQRQLSGNGEERDHGRRFGERAPDRWARRMRRRHDFMADSARDILDFSSRGPTDDLRQKPDLVAPGTHVVGA